MAKHFPKYVKKCVKNVNFFLTMYNYLTFSTDDYLQIDLYSSKELTSLSKN